MEKHNLIIFPFCITGPSLPYGVDYSVMAESPDGKGVILFGGDSHDNPSGENRILELRAGTDSWNILDVSLEHGRSEHSGFCMCIDNIFENINF